MCLRRRGVGSGAARRVALRRRGARCRGLLGGHLVGRRVDVLAPSRRLPARCGATALRRCVLAPSVGIASSVVSRPVAPRPSHRQPSACRACQRPVNGLVDMRRVSCPAQGQGAQEATWPGRATASRPTNSALSHRAHRGRDRGRRRPRRAADRDAVPGRRGRGDRHAGAGEPAVAHGAAVQPSTAPPTADAAGRPEPTPVARARAADRPSSSRPRRPRSTRSR